MGIAARELRLCVIRPTLAYLGRAHRSAEALLLGVAASQSHLGEALHDRRGGGLYRIGAQRHTAVWDDFLARDPALASLVRGLASQHAFLVGPQVELVVNLRYATAIAWMLVEQQGPRLPAHDDIDGLARIWRQIFQPHGRLRDFSQAWNNCISQNALSAS